MKRRSVVVALVGAGALGAAWLGRAKIVGAGGGGDSEQQRQVLAAPTERDEVVAPGRVEAETDVIDLGFEQGGRIIALLVNEGDHVSKGQVLARLDDRLAAARVARAQAALDAARARRDAAFRGSRLAEIRAVEAEADAARTQATNEATERARGERLLGKQAITDAEAERLRSGAQASAARAAAADARLAVVREGTRGELKRAAMAEVAGLQAELEETRLLWAQMELRAPTDGVVLRRHAEIGEQVSLVPPTVVLSMANLDKLQVRAEVDEEDIARIGVNQTGFVRVDAYGERRFPGKVVRVMGDLGRKAIRNDDPKARVDTRVLEVIFVFDTTPTLPLGLRVDLHLPVPAGRRG
ncbi:MAG TPA: efflux RND transporter periplasmic adaptor subunit [Polyangia bacterium]|nr:efflux RND transporter periplasmic adaptor subunit [Polyangia bacterium]